MRPPPHSRNRSFGIIGGLGPLAGADLFFKLVKSTPARGDAEHFDLIFEQHPFTERSGRPEDALTERKLYIFDMIRHFEQRGVDSVILPCFLSHTFIDELQAESRLPIINMLEALRLHVERRHPGVRRVGVLATPYVRQRRLFEQHFAAPEFGVVYPRIDFVDAVYGPSGIKAGVLQGPPIELLHAACADLIEQGAELILPGLTEIPIVAEAVGLLPVPLVDTNLVYAQFAVSGAHRSPRKPFKIGVVGGVGPAATVDFVGKIVGNTPATRDQEHIKLVVEQNPQIPDRTENLLGEGVDPTISLYATCKKLEAGDADLIAIPCNTAHAYVERIQPYLSIPILNMLSETAAFLRREFPGVREVGLLATSGTVDSGVYAGALAAVGVSTVVPDAAYQELVMRAIYGPQGVKAGHTRGQCRADIEAAAGHLAARGVEVIILGCTELPLLFDAPTLPAADGAVALIDPTLVLARACIAQAAVHAASAATTAPRLPAG